MFEGKKTYILGVMIVAVSVIMGMGYIDKEIGGSIVAALLGGMGITLRSGIKKDSDK